MYNNNRLFREGGTGSLDSVIRNQGERLESHIKELSFAEVNEAGEAFIKELVQGFTMVAPTLNENQIKVTPREAEITINPSRHSRLYDDGPIQVKGLAITVQIPFSGNKDLFRFCPSTYSMSGTPEGRVNENTLELYYETAEKDAEKIKALWAKDIKEINQNLEWVRRDVSVFNNALEATIKRHLENRKKQASESQSLIDRLKLN